MLVVGWDHHNKSSNIELELSKVGAEYGMTTRGSNRAAMLTTNPLADRLIST